MCVTTTRAETRRADIRDAAIVEFMRRGYAATSMAHIAESAGVSRPALYQYFSDKEDVFTAAFAGVFEERVDAAIAELHAGATTREGLEAVLQRYDGDLWELTSSSPHHEELMQAKNPAIAAAVGVEVARLWDAVADYLKAAAPGRSAAQQARRSEWLDMLRGSPGLRFDSPDPATYRRRLTALARAVAADIEAST